MTETVNSAVKRSFGFAVRARSWFREFREIALMCVVYNIKRAVKQCIPPPYGDSTQPIILKTSIGDSLTATYDVTYSGSEQVANCSINISERNDG
ncbi:hypothetical protein J2752_002867 [Halarchaeum rubridurum]|uniref:Transposase DDE domain-containing protein n=1 Tax=Halarchaeum rubridurum TaxID=489911 RepID=A0A830G4F6_9EURY|nr:hypothetical protein [Halarchaeum rubridurum]GGM75753.1 hypothetical protein GCM10009017_27130 [Halarchaeum rubridurum]